MKKINIITSFSYSIS